LHGNNRKDASRVSGGIGQTLPLLGSRLWKNKLIWKSCPWEECLWCTLLTQSSLGSCFPKICFTMLSCSCTHEYNVANVQRRMATAWAGSRPRDHPSDSGFAGIQNARVWCHGGFYMSVKGRPGRPGV
jgi:hypothetical protein